MKKSSGKRTRKPLNARLSVPKCLLHRMTSRLDDDAAKTLLRRLERANSATPIDHAMRDFKQALSVRHLLPRPAL
jgi:hypothetical protein